MDIPKLDQIERRIAVQDKHTISPILLDIKVKPIHNSVSQGTRILKQCQLVTLRTECSPEEVGKVNGGSLRLDYLVASGISSQRKKDFFACCLTDWDILC